MRAVNVTFRVDEKTKNDFDTFCDDVGINITTAFNMFMRAVLRTRELPFPITDVDLKMARDNVSLREALKEAQEQAIINGTSDMTLEEINNIIAECRKEKQGQK